MTKQIVFGPDKDSYGVNLLKSFVEHVEYYQTWQQLTNHNQVSKFVFADNYTYAVFDYFELQSSTKPEFTATTILVIETFIQFIHLVNLNKLDSSVKYLVISESWWDVNFYEFDFDYKLIFISWDLIDFQRRLAIRDNLYYYMIDLDMLDNYAPKYDFLCLIGMNKDWRNNFVDKLLKTDVSNSLISYYGKCLGHTDLLNLDLFYTRSDKLDDFENKFYNNNTVNEFGHAVNLSYSVNLELFNKSKFSLVVETVAKHFEYHLTEKTLKCLILGHPFVVMGSWQFLRFLHQLGFKTYNEIFDESYDEISDLNARMQAVINLVNTLKTKHFDINTLKKIQNHNLVNFMRLRPSTEYKNFCQFFNSITS